MPISCSDTAHIYEGAILRVRWMRYQGSFPAKAFLEGYRDDFARFLQRVQEMGDTGTVIAGHGHPLKGRFRVLHQFNMPLTRSWGFRDDGVYIVCDAGLKKKAKEQEADYERALLLREDYLTGPFDD